MMVANILQTIDILVDVSYDVFVGISMTLLPVFGIIVLERVRRPLSLARHS